MYKSRYVGSYFFCAKKNTPPHYRVAYIDSIVIYRIPFLRTSNSRFASCLSKYGCRGRTDNRHDCDMTRRQPSHHGTVCDVPSLPISLYHDSWIHLNIFCLYLLPDIIFSAPLANCIIGDSEVPAGCRKVPPKPIKNALDCDWIRDVLGSFNLVTCCTEVCLCVSFCAAAWTAPPISIAHFVCTQYITPSFSLIL